MSDAPKPPRFGEGDRLAQPRGGGVFATSRTNITQARKDRRSGNPAEVALWLALRTRPGGHKFRRQHPIANRRLDFACLAARVAVEVDGEAHNTPGQAAADAGRDAELAALGFVTVRVMAGDVFGDLEAVVRRIVQVCDERSNPLHRRSDGPPPHNGEVLGTLQTTRDGEV